MFDRRRLQFRPLSERKNRVDITREAFSSDTPLRAIDEPSQRAVDEAATAIRNARNLSAPVVLAFGAHTIKNGAGPLLSQLAHSGWITHFATNGAAIIHDWEFAYQGTSSEHVEENVASGQFGLWEETGYYLNLAIAIGAYEGLGYGESVGSMVARDGVEIPSRHALAREVTDSVVDCPARSAAAGDLLQLIDIFNLSPGFRSVRHPYKQFGFQAAAWRMGVPLTGHPMFGHDIIYCHPMNQGAAIGRTAERDFLTFADAISGLENGVYLSVGSAVMSPMIFEKSFSMAQNLALQAGGRIANHKIYVVDLLPVNRDWRKAGEPGEDDPTYYLRFLKTFSRMGGTMEYIAADNRLFLQHLYHALQELNLST